MAHDTEEEEEAGEDRDTGDDGDQEDEDVGEDVEDDGDDTGQDNATRWRELVEGSQLGGVVAGAALVAASSYVDEALKNRFGDLDDEGFKARLDRAIEARFVSVGQQASTARDLRDEFCHDGWVPPSEASLEGVFAFAQAWFEVSHLADGRRPLATEVDNFLAKLKECVQPVRIDLPGQHATCSVHWDIALLNAAKNESSLVRSGAVLMAASILDVQLIELLGKRECATLSVRGKLERARERGELDQESEDEASIFLASVRNPIAHDDQRPDPEHARGAVSAFMSAAFVVQAAIEERNRPSPPPPPPLPVAAIHGPVARPKELPSEGRLFAMVGTLLIVGVGVLGLAGSRPRGIVSRTSAPHVPLPTPSIAPPVGIPAAAPRPSVKPFGHLAAAVAARVILPNEYQAGPTPEPNESTTDAFRLCDWSFTMIRKKQFSKAEEALVDALYERHPLPWTKGALLYNLGLIAREADDIQSAHWLFHMSLEARPGGPAAEKVAKECAMLGRGACIYYRDEQGHLR